MSPIKRPRIPFFPSGLKPRRISAATSFRVFWAVVAMSLTGSAMASISVSVDKLDPSDGIPMPPSHLIIVDVFTHSTADSGWGAAGIFGTTVPGSGAVLHYAHLPSGAATPHPSGERFVTFISLPRNRDDDERFDSSARTAVFGGATGGPAAVYVPIQLNIAYGYPPPPPIPPPAAEGYIARIALDLSNVVDPLFRMDSSNIIVAETPPPDSLVLFESIRGFPDDGVQVFGYTSEYDGIDWGIYGIIPEPATGVLTLLASALLIRRR